MKVSRENFDDLLLDYVYGELDAAARTAFEAYVADHPDAQAALAEMRDTRAALSPLAADLEPSQVTTNRVLAHARDAAERMEGGRSWSFFPRYATALAAVFVGAFTLIVLRPVVQRQSESQLVRGADAVSPHAETEPAREYDEVGAAAFDEVAPADNRRGFAVGGAAFENETARDAGRAGAREEGGTWAFNMERAAPDQDGRLEDADVYGGVGSESVDAALLRARRVAAAPPAAARESAKRLDDSLMVGGAAVGSGFADATEEPLVLNRLAYQGPVTLAEEARVQERDAPLGVLAAKPLAKPKLEVANAASEPAVPEAKAAAAEPNEVAAGDRLNQYSAEPESAESALRADKSDGQWRTVAKSQPQVPLNRWLVAGREQQLAGAHRDAIRNFQLVVLNAPDAPVAAEAQYETARSLMDLGDCPRAVATFQDILDNAPAFPERDEVLLAQAVCFNRLRDFEAELERYAMFEAEHPTRAAEISTQRVLAEQQLVGRVKKAREPAIPATTGTK